MHSFSNLRHCERDERYRFHGDRDNHSEVRIGAVFYANNLETAYAADAESPFSLRISTPSYRFNGRCTAFKPTPSPYFCAPNREPHVDRQLRRGGRQR